MINKINTLFQLNLNILIRGGTHHRAYPCRWCLNFFYQKLLRIKHEEYCSKNEAVVRDYPSVAKDNDATLS